METSYLKTLLTVVEAGSFSKAADILCVTQSAVSQRLKFMEEQYGVTLLDRSRATLVPTAAGELVIAKARLIIEHESSMVKELNSLPLRPHISLGCSPCFGSIFLAELFDSYIVRQLERIEFSVEFVQADPAIAGLRETKYSAIVVEHFMPLDFSDFATTALPGDHMVFISNPALGLKCGQLPLRQLLKHTLLAKKDGCSATQQLTSNLLLFGMTIENFHTVIGLDDPRLIVRTILSGPYIAFVSGALVRQELNEGLVNAHTVEGFVHGRDRTLVTARRKHSDPRLKELVKAIADTVEQVTRVQEPLPHQAGLR